MLSLNFILFFFCKVLTNVPHGCKGRLCCCLFYIATAVVSVQWQYTSSSLELSFSEFPPHLQLICCTPVITGVALVQATLGILAISRLEVLCAFPQQFLVNLYPYITLTSQKPTEGSFLANSCHFLNIKSLQKWIRFRACTLLPGSMEWMIDWIAFEAISSCWIHIFILTILTNCSTI